MTYIIFEMWSAILAAAALGAVCGWVARGGNAKSAKTATVKGHVVEMTDLGANHPVQEIEGVGKAYTRKLKGIGVRKTLDLLDLCRDEDGRERLAKYLGVEVFVIRKWTSQADLMRLKGLTGQIADLLEASDVKSLTELSDQEAEALAKKLAKINAKEHRVSSLPEDSELTAWVTNAKDMQALMHA